MSQAVVRLLPLEDVPRRAENGRAEIQANLREQHIWRVMATLHHFCGYKNGSPADHELWSHMSAARAVVDELFPPSVI